MPRFSNALPKIKKHMGFDLKRTPTDRPLRAIVTSESLVVCDTHFWGGRTIPCERPDCPACNQSVPFRTHCYVACFDPLTHDHFIFECTEHAARAFEEFSNAAGVIRGCFFSASRPKKTKNAKVVIICKPYDPTKCILPSDPDVMKALCVIWRVPPAGFPLESAGRGRKKSKSNCNVLADMHEQPDNANYPTKIDEILSGNGKSDRFSVVT